MAKPMDEARYGFSEDEELVQSALHELTSAIESQDKQKLIESLMAIITLIQSKESDHADAQ